MWNFSNKVIVVTGAAGNLGQAVVKEFLNFNGIVVGLDHRKGRLEGLIGFPKKQGKFYIFEQIDVTDRNAMVQLGQQIQASVGPVNVLVNTVGGFTAGESVHELSSETWQRMMALNVTSLLNASAAFVPLMIANGHGKFVTIGSKAALHGSAKTGAYSAAKSAVLRLTESMATELKGDNIQVNCVLPGTIDTPENRQAMPNADFNKWVTPQQVAEVILFLSSPASDAVSGAALPVFGRS